MPSYDMICASKEKAALKSLHYVLCHTRSMALLGESGARIADVLDWAELLPIYLASDQDQTSQFIDALQSIAERCPEISQALNMFRAAESVGR